MLGECVDFQIYHWQCLLYLVLRNSTVAKWVKLKHLDANEEWSGAKLRIGEPRNEEKGEQVIETTTRQGG